MGLFYEGNQGLKWACFKGKAKWAYSMTNQLKGLKFYEGNQLEGL